MGSTRTSPVNYRGVMVSSTFRDLTEHRAALIRAIRSHGFADVAMENDAAKPDVDVIDSSLQMVRDASAYAGVISRKYGQKPVCPVRNPDGRSLTELEFNEAQRLGRPILLFIMGEEHRVREADVEIDPDERAKLAAFRERAKKIGPDSSVHRVYTVFESLEQFTEKAGASIAALGRFLDERGEAARPAEPAAPHGRARERDAIPVAPAFYAEPPYIGSHEFVGRAAQLDTLNDWAVAADPHPVLLFEAIGGTGKSMLAWHWITLHAASTRRDWAGRLWYSFYERGAVMADFCRRALAYVTGQPLEAFAKKRTPELGDRLLRELQSRPWLLVLDGLERVLVAYNRFDAAQIADEDAGTSDQIAHRDPCAAIRPEDDDVLRALAGAAPSKLLFTSRLIPRVLLNPSSQPIPGVLRERLPGLRPPDAEALLRAGGIRGTSGDIQSYLKTHCDCHPLVTGVLAGLINDYLPDRGNFDAWAADREGGDNLNLAALNLVQKRNHILNSALAALPDASRALLSTLALLSESVDYETLAALNPHMLAEPEEVEEPSKLEAGTLRKRMSDEERRRTAAAYAAALARRGEYEQALEAWRASPERAAAPMKLRETVHDLERRGLLQYDARTKRHDLHPVVRGVAAGGLRPEQKARYGQRVVDHFSQQAHSPYEQAETIDDLRQGLQVVRTLCQMGRLEEAAVAYCGGLSEALFFNLEAKAEALSLMRPFFPLGWASPPSGISNVNAAYLATDAGALLRDYGELDGAFAAHGTVVRIDLAHASWHAVQTDLHHFQVLAGDEGWLAKRERYGLLALEVAALTSDREGLFMGRLFRFVTLRTLGRLAEAEEVWSLLDPMGRDWRRAVYRSGEAETRYARFRFERGDLAEIHLGRAEELTQAGKHRGGIRRLYAYRGEWRLEQGEWRLALESLREAVRMAREIGQTDSDSEAMLALAKLHLGELPDPRHEVERLASAKEPAHRFLAALWLAAGDRELAKKHALLAYKGAWADGEPYVFRYDLDKARALLEQLGVGIPNLPPYDPAKDKKLDWEDELVAAIETLRAERAAKPPS